MAREIFIPKLGQTVDEVKLVEWLAPDGALVEEGQEILEVETDKTNFRVEALAGGYLHRGPFAEGSVVPVLTVVAVIGKQDEGFGEAGSQGTAQVERRGDRDAAEAAAASAGHPVVASPGLSVTASLPQHLAVSPRARKLSTEKQVNLTQAGITPTGGEGVRIVERDVLAYLASTPKATPLAEKVAAEAGLDLRELATVRTGARTGGKITREDVEQALRATAPASPPAAPRTELPAAEIGQRIPLRGIRAIIADRMATSVHTTARVTLMTDADATELVAMRQRLKAKVEAAWGFAPGYNDLLALIVARALRQFPYMNARLASDAIEQMAHVNLGMAVDTERGLLVPVIRDADRLSLRQFGTAFRELVDRARTGRSLPDDLTGGSFTVTNLGMFDVDGFTPVINLPEAAILGVGRISPKWVYRPESPNAPVLRQMWTLSLVFDHRLVDGAPAARFLQHIKGVIEEPYLLLAT